MSKEEEILRASSRFHDRIAIFCTPLLTHFQISHFWYAKITNDGHFSYLASHLNLAEDWIQAGFYKKNPNIRHPSFYASGVSIMRDIEDADFVEEVDCFKRKYSVYPNINIFKKLPDGLEQYGFGSKFPCKKINGKLINELPNLRLFFQYFREENVPIFKQLEDSQVSLIDIMGEEFFHPKEAVVAKPIGREAFLKDIGVIHKRPLSKQEMKVLEELSNGHSAREIGEKLCLSPRTVEHYVGNIKNKLNCHSKRELFEKSKFFFSSHEL